MILKYRISLAGIKGFARVYELRSSMTLYDFHKVMRDEMEFPRDQQIQFKALDEKGALVARYAMFDLGSGTVDDITLENTLSKGVASFIYFYDVTNKKSVIITFEGEVENPVSSEFPALIESKGPNPIEFENGYVAYEDLPDEQKHLHPGHSVDSEEDDIDEGDDDELDEGDDEDGSEIYDEDEEL